VRRQPRRFGLDSSKEFAQMTISAKKYRRWFEYEIDSNAKVLASLQAVPDDRRVLPEFQKAVNLMAHLVAARNMWLYRLGQGSKPADLFPENTPITDLPRLIEETQAAWSSYFSTLTDDKIAQSFEYQSYDGPRFRNTIEDVLTQLYGHSLYHRGQIALILRSIGAEPAATDFIYWTREPLDM
jgi:uncharacterized damage-inducible protein DinB